MPSGNDTGPTVWTTTFVAVSMIEMEFELKFVTEDASYRARKRAETRQLPAQMTLIISCRWIDTTTGLAALDGRGVQTRATIAGATVAVRHAELDVASRASTLPRQLSRLAAKSGTFRCQTDRL